MDRRSFLALGAAGLTWPFLKNTAFAKAAEKFKPGEFIWQPDLSPVGPLVFIVSLPEQLVHVYRNGVEIGISTISSGKPGHRTPTGVFVILQKHKDHYSSTYNNAPMPNMQRLTWSGIALHAGALPGYPASHGCVRLPKAFSAQIFGITSLGIPVIIADNDSDPEHIVHPGLILPTDAELKASEAVRKAAKKPPVGQTNVASGVVSGADGKAYLLIDGQIAWESSIDITKPNQPLGDHAYTLVGPTADGNAFNWLAASLGAKVQTSADPVLSRIKVDKEDEVMEILASTESGSALVVTDKPATAQTRSAKDFVIIDAEA